MGSTRNMQWSVPSPWRLTGLLSNVVAGMHLTIDRLRNHGDRAHGGSDPRDVPRWDTCWD